GWSPAELGHTARLAAAHRQRRCGEHRSETSSVRRTATITAGPTHHGHAIYARLQRAAASVAVRPTLAPSDALVRALPCVRPDSPRRLPSPTRNRKDDSTIVMWLAF